MGERRFLVAAGDLGETRAIIRGDEHHHLSRVLRLKAGDTVSVFDGAGRGFRGRIVSAGPDEASVSLEAPENPAVEPRVRLVLLQGMPHGDRMDAIVEKATELGVARIVPVSTERSVVKPRTTGWGRLDRFRRIAIAAAKQSGRLVIPEIGEALRFEEAIRGGLSNAVAGIAARVIFHPGGGDFRRALPGRPDLVTISLLVGPEGGFTDAEFDEARSAGWEGASLGARILRADTAAIAALTLVAQAAGALD